MEIEEEEKSNIPKVPSYMLVVLIDTRPHPLH